MVQDLHPELYKIEPSKKNPDKLITTGGWARYPAKYDQMGLNASHAGNSFCIRPGTYKDMVSLDVVSMYGSILSRLPDPVTAKFVDVKNESFNPDKFRGMFGVLLVDGESLDDLHPPIRVIGKTKLRYVFGAFKKQWVTIPELMIGIERGALRIDYVHDGFYMLGSQDTSFIRHSIVRFAKIKNDADKVLESWKDKYGDDADTWPEEVFKAAQPHLVMRELAKLLGNAIFRKFCEIVMSANQIQHPVLVPSFVNRWYVARSMIRIAVELPDELDDKFYLKEKRPSNKDSCAVPSKVKAIYKEAIAKYKANEMKLTTEDYIMTYAEALLAGGEPTHLNAKNDPEMMLLAKYIKQGAKHSTGGYWMPLYASLTTGFGSAMVSAMAHYTRALQGDTDSVHFVLPNGILPGDLHKTQMAQDYYECMKRAGYPNPRQMGKGQPIVDGIEGLGTYGTWKIEQKIGSVETHLVALKRYSHKFINETGKVFYKQAVHTVVGYWDPEIEQIHDPNPREQKKKRKNREKELIHEKMMGALVKGKEVTYSTRRKPIKPKAAYRRGLQAGKFESELRVITPIQEDENTWTDTEGFIHWRPL